LKKIPVIILALLLISGCTSTISGCKNDKLSDDPYKEIFSGTEGVVIEYALNAPPDRVTADESFPIAVKVFNKGAINVIGAHLIITAESPRFVTASYTKTIGTTEAPLEGKESNLAGGLDIFPVDEKATAMSSATSDQPESIDGVIMATICYKYETRLVTGACIVTEPYKLSEIPDACTMESLTFKDQGAPIAITQVEPSVVTQEEQKYAQFKISFQNTGTGLTVDHDDTKLALACSENGGTAAKDLYNVIYATGKFGSMGLLCDTQKKLPEGKRTIMDNPTTDYFICRSSTPITNMPNAFTSDLSVVLSYGYTQSISKIIRIESPFTSTGPAQ
jgi:hypothetical protein